MPFRLSAIGREGGGEVGVDIEFHDENAVIETIALAYDFRDWPVELSEVWFDDDGLVIGRVVWIGDGRTNGVVINRGAETAGGVTATVQVAPRKSWMQEPGPRRSYTTSCAWTFKDADCAYAGATTTCDRTYAACLAIGNTIRFGGFRFAPRAGTILTWGTRERVLTGTPAAIPPPTTGLRRRG
jgi:hypothetical protein